MGHCATGARVCHGEGVFMTWSPNEQHSCIVLRVMRTREADPLLHEPMHANAAARAFHAALKATSTMKYPSMRSSTSEDAATVALPLYNMRKKLAARDPRAVVEAFMYEVKCKLPWLLGLKVCPWCPRCNEEERPNARPCRDISRTNSLPMGGAIGLVATLGGRRNFRRRQHHMIMARLMS